MHAASNFGGWAPGSPVSTSSASSVYVGYQRDSVEQIATANNTTAAFVRCLGWAVVAGAALTGWGGSGEIPAARWQSGYNYRHNVPAISEEEHSVVVRTPLEDLVRIRDVLHPAISDLATTFGVSRQSVYNWLKGEPVAFDNSEKLRDLAMAADVLADASIEVNASMLKRKFVGGRTLLQVAQAGESARGAALQLVQIYKREATQRSRLAARFENRPRSSPTEDFDLPSANDFV